MEGFRDDNRVPAYWNHNFFTGVKRWFFLAILFLSLTAVSRGQDEDPEQKSVDTQRMLYKGHPVIGVLGDTIFHVYTRTGAILPHERAMLISERIKILAERETFSSDSLVVEEVESALDITYGELIVMNVSSNEAAAHGKPDLELSYEIRDAISESILAARSSLSLPKLLLRLLYAFIAGLVTVLLIWLFAKGYQRILRYFDENKARILKNFTYKEYTFLSADQEMRIVLVLLKALRWFFNVLFVYLSLSFIFSIFPMTRGWANRLFDLVWQPLITLFSAIWQYIPNMFTILVIVVVMRYFIKLVKYIFTEIDAGKLRIPDFHTDWAMPTYGIVRVLLYAFMLVLIFPYLPGSNSNIFRGVSVFIGVLISFGSSSAISNMVAGLVITYMRPFRIGDKIKIGEITGVVTEKTLLVTRLKTIQNEEITIPNSTVLNGNTTNYSAFSQTDGLRIHTTVTIGYDVPWRTMHETLIEAAKKTKYVLPSPQPFVWQTSLEDFYVAYQINAYVNDPHGMIEILSELHQNIQDECNARGIEIMSPHYRAMRDGNTTTIPADYLDKDYAVPSFKVKIDKEEKTQGKEEKG